MRSRKKRLAQGHHSNCQHNLCFANAKATSISTKQSDRFLIGSLACTHLAWSWEWEEYQKWHSWWLFYNPNLTPSPRSFPAIQHLQEQHTHTHTHLSVHKHRVNAKKGSHSHSWDNLCVWVWWPWCDADATRLWEQSRASKVWIYFNIFPSDYSALSLTLSPMPTG